MEIGQTLLVAVALLVELPLQPNIVVVVVTATVQLLAVIMSGLAHFVAENGIIAVMKKN